MTTRTHEQGAIAFLHYGDTGAGIQIFENPRVRESRAVGYNRTKIYRRKEPLRLWVGSEAKKYDIEWRWVIPHLEMLFPDSWKRKLDGWILMIQSNADGGGTGPEEVNFDCPGVSTGGCLISNYEIEQNFDSGAGGAWGEGTDVGGTYQYEYNEMNAYSRIITVRITMESQYQNPE